jgi:hypothetical protein
MTREHLPSRRPSTTFDFTCANLHYTCSYSRFASGGIAELFLSNHASNSHADTAARDTAIACSLALQFGAEVETIRKALCRDSHGRASGPLGAALDIIAAGQRDSR